FIASITRSTIEKRRKDLSAGMFSEATSICISDLIQPWLPPSCGRLPPLRLLRRCDENPIQNPRPADFDNTALLRQPNGTGRVGTKDRGPGSSPSSCLSGA